MKKFLLVIAFIGLFFSNYANATIYPGVLSMVGTKIYGVINGYTINGDVTLDSLEDIMLQGWEEINISAGTCVFSIDGEPDGKWEIEVMSSSLLQVLSVGGCKGIDQCFFTFCTASIPLGYVRKGEGSITFTKKY